MNKEEQTTVPYPIFLISMMMVLFFAFSLIHQYSMTFKAEIDIHQHNFRWQVHSAAIVVFVSATLSMMLFMVSRPEPRTRNMSWLSMVSLVSGVLLVAYGFHWTQYSIEVGCIGVFFFIIGVLSFKSLSKKVQKDRLNIRNKK